MNEVLVILLRIAGAGLLLLAVLHVPVSRRLGWRKEGSLLSPVNRAIFHVHAFFICVVLAMMGLPCLVEPQILLIPTRAGGWLAWSSSAFWTMRLYCQWFVYPAGLWRGKRLETTVHFILSLVWATLACLFAACGLWQAGWWHR